MGRQHNELEWSPTARPAGGKKGAWTRKKLRARRIEMGGGTSALTRRARKEAERARRADATLRLMDGEKPKRRNGADPQG